LSFSELSFQELGLSEPILAAVTAEGYTIPTPIQSQAIEHIVAGRDLLGCAQTGTGKTAAFALPILHYLDTNRRQAEPRAPRVLILSPTRELASQISQSFRTYGKNIRFRQTTVFGGVGQHPQVKALTQGVHVLVATPGRLLDLMDQKHVRLDKLEVFVLDEADRMLDMGFMPDLKRIVSKLPAKRQSLFFSATMPPSIASLASGLLSNPVRVTITPPATTVDRINQRVLFVNQANKAELLGNLLEQKAFERVIVFTRTKHGADKVAKYLNGTGVSTDAIHGNKSQTARERALLQFRKGAAKVLVATDIASRGIDVDGISHVINFDLPVEPEAYVHRIGRTGRAGAEGSAISFCDRSERGALRAIEKLVRRTIEVDAEHPFHAGSQGPPKGGAGRPGRKEREGARPGRRGPANQGSASGNGGGNGGRYSGGGTGNGGGYSGGNSAGNSTGPNAGKRPFNKRKKRKPFAQSR
jgi:ATP-dependent RNA helicase RhlE